METGYVVPFDQIISTSYIVTRYGAGSLTVKTTIGAVVITNRLEEFPAVLALFQRISRENQSRIKQAGSKSPKAPQIPTPLSGLLILAGAVALIVAIAWYTLFHGK